ncbi:MAG: GSCFA domain-containing protein, partial [Flavobacteriales bacterium]
VDANPNGIVFNPLSLAFAMEGLLEGKPDRLVKRGNEWVSLDHHGSFSSPSMELLESQIALRRAGFLQGIKQAKLLTVTFGTAQVWRHLISDTIVANCHKLPTQDFKSEVLSVETIVKTWASTIRDLNKINPGLQVIFTVSPVRYKRGGAHQNTLSKSVLHLAVHDLCEQFDNTSYFPAYEICIDELRDYRFFADDYSHPSAQAIQHVYARFQESIMNSQTIEKSQKIAQLNKALAHRYSTEEEQELAQRRIELEISELLK